MGIRFTKECGPGRSCSANPYRTYTSLLKSAGDTPSGLPRVNERRIYDTDTEFAIIDTIPVKIGTALFFGILSIFKWVISLLDID